MKTQDLVRIARERAGLTQAQLATRSGRPRETIARWETGRQEPSLSALRELVDAAGLELVIRLAEADDSLRDRVREQLDRLPLQRLAALLPADVNRDTLHALRWLAGAEIPTIVIGPVGAALQGGPQRPAEGQVEFVAADPTAMESHLAAAGLVPVDVESRWRDSDARAPWSLPRGGTLVLAARIPGTRDFPDLRRGAQWIDIGQDRRVRVAHPRDLLRMAEASPSDSERARVPGLRALLGEIS